VSSREQVSAAIKEAWTPERINELLDDLVAQEVQRSFDVQCKFCRKTGNYKLNVQDQKARHYALTTALEHGYGKAPASKDADQKPIDQNVDVDTMSVEARDKLKAQLIARLGKTA
jgi:hypothetical protein